MPKKSEESARRIPSLVLATVCLVTAFMCQTRFKIAKEIKPEITPSLLKSDYFSMIYGFGKPDRFRLVLRTYIVISSPMVSLMSTALLLVGTKKFNPYLFLPWLFVTLKGLLLVQTQNLRGILVELFSRYDQMYVFSFEDWKWSCLYFTIFFFIIAECFALLEVIDILRAIWNKQYFDLSDEYLRVDPSEVDGVGSVPVLKLDSAVNTSLEEYHTITSLCKLGLFADDAPSNSVTKLKSLIALFRKKY